jgi:hypothetical protein
MRQSNPQDFSGRKQALIDDQPCEKCTKKHEEEIKEAQALMGRIK